MGCGVEMWADGGRWSCEGGGGGCGVGGVLVVRERWVGVWGLE